MNEDRIQKKDGFRNYVQTPFRKLTFLKFAFVCASWLRGIPTQTTHAVDPRGTPGERQGMMCKPHHSQSSKGSNLGQMQKTLQCPENSRINIQATDLQFKYLSCKNDRITIILKFKWQKGIQVCVCIYIYYNGDILEFTLLGAAVEAVYCLAMVILQSLWGLIIHHVYFVECSDN